jgi:hypothetical protein
MSQGDYEDDFELEASDSEKALGFSATSVQGDGAAGVTTDVRGNAAQTEATGHVPDASASELASAAQKSVQEALSQAQTTLQELMQTHLALLEASAQEAEQRVSIV